MCRAAKVYVGVFALLMLCQVSSGVLTAEHFNYDLPARPLTGLGGGPNWGSSWAGYDNLSPGFDPSAGLIYFGSCYGNSCSYTDTLSGGAVNQSNRGIWRWFDGALSDVVWVSALTKLGESSSRGFGAGDIDFDPMDFRLVFGLTNAPRAYVELRGYERVEGSVVLSTSETHLLLAKIEINYDELGHERVSLWVDPLDTCNGAAGLGDPDAVVDGYDAVASWEVFMFVLGNGSSADGIRISHGADASMEEALPCEPPTPVESSSWTRVKAEYR